MESKIKISSLLTFFIVAGCTSGQLLAALDDDTDSSEEQANKNQVVVTGSRITKVDIKSLSPVFSISREEIDKLGYANVKDVIDNMTQNSGGTIDNSATFGFTPGASAVNLRGLGFGQTLTLIDGRRLPIYPIGISGTTNFVDLSSIPMAFVERIEVLTDGASAVYGSDAVAGVINVITRKDMAGIALNLRTSTTSDGGYETQRFNLLTGARNGDTQVDVILDYWLQEPLLATDRNYTNSDVANPRGQYSSFGSSFLGLDSNQIVQDPNCGTSADALAGLGVSNVSLPVYEDDDLWCGYDRSPHRQLIAPQERISLMTRVHYEIDSSLAFFSRLGLSRLATVTEMEPNFYGGGEFSGNGVIVPNIGGEVAVGAANNPTNGTSAPERGVFVRRLTEFGPRRSDIQNDAVNLLAGFKGDLLGGLFDWEFGVSYNKTELDIDENNILLSGLNSAVENGLDLFQPIPSSTVDLLSFTANRKAYSVNRVIDFAISGDTPLQLSDGPMKFALAFEHVKESYQDKPDSLVRNMEGFGGSSNGKGERAHLGIGGELNLPFSSNLELDVALRWDEYDDKSSVNSALSPRVSMAYTLNESLLTRLSWGKSFRAPDMQRLFGGETRGFVDLVDPLLFDPANGENGVVQSVQILTQPNIELSEERGTNINLGILWQANDALAVSLDLFDISLTDIVFAVSPQVILNACTIYGELCELVERDSTGTLTGIDASITTGPINFAKQETQGIDITADYDWSNSFGNWNAKMTTTWIRNFDFLAFEGAETTDSVALGFFPEYRSNMTLDWQKEKLGATLKVSYVDNIAGRFSEGNNDQEAIASWTTLNGNFRYQYSDFTRLSLGINNLTNRRPPQDPTQNNWPWFANDGGFSNSIGREVYVQIDANF
jgi:iron complex outermembrane receptor protein